MVHCPGLAFFVLWLTPLVLFGESVGTIFEIKGDVKVTPAGGAAAAAVRDGPVNEGDRILTGDKPSFVQINFKDTSIVKLGPNTDLTITTKSPKLKKTGVIFKKDKLIDTTELDLAAGDALIKVEGFKKKSASFEVRTPTAVAGVRGTMFRRQFTPAVAGAPPKDTCTCYQGTVEYSARNIPAPRVEVVRANNESGVTGEQQNVEPPRVLPPERRNEVIQLFDGGITPPPPPPPGPGGVPPPGPMPPPPPPPGALNPELIESFNDLLIRDILNEARTDTIDQAAPTIQGGPVPLPSGAGELPRPPDPPPVP